jgi:hypothetical protein
MSSTLQTVAIIIGIVIALGIAGMYFGGKTITSTGSYISNSTNESVLLAWAGVPIGSFLVDTGNAWIRTAVTLTEFIIVMLCLAGTIFYYANKK